MWALGVNDERKQRVEYIAPFRATTSGEHPILWYKPTYRSHPSTTSDSGSSSEPPSDIKNFACF